MSSKVNVKIRLELDGIKEKAARFTKLGQYALVNQAHADMNIYAPKKVGDLRSQSTIGIDGKTVHWNVPYSRYQFYGRFSNYTTPGTGRRWDLKAESIHMASWKRVTKKAMK